MRKKKTRIEDLPLPSTIEPQIRNLSQTLYKQIEKEALKNKFSSTATVLKMVGAGFFLAGSIAFPNLPKALAPLLTSENDSDFNAWKKFNLPYIKRVLKRLEKQKLVRVINEKEGQTIEITQAGERKILKYALSEIKIEKPRFWDGKWRLISYDIPGDSKGLREILREFLRNWGFYPLHESVFLHAYPCEKEVEFLKEYLAIGEFVRIFIVSKIENDKPFRDFFGV